MLKIIFTKIYTHAQMLVYHAITACLFRYNGVVCNRFVSVGIPFVKLHANSIFHFEDGLVLVNTFKDSTLGKTNRCKILVYDDAVLKIGRNVAMSNSVIISTKEIVIGDNVMIGGGVTIVDSDFHSMNSNDWFTVNDELMMKRKSVIVGNNVFLGMNTIVLKGVVIGDNVRVAAGSVVIRNIPSNQIWGGNPAVYIKKCE